jgi:uncharacterized membrane protein
MTQIHKAHRAWQATLVLYVMLILALIVDHTLVRQHFFLPVLLIQTLPLLLVLPGLLKQQARSGIWLCFMILFHFLSAISNAFTSAQHIFYVGMAILIVTLFSTALLFVRWQTRS